MAEKLGLWNLGTMNELLPEPFLINRDKKNFSEHRYLKSRPIEYFENISTDMGGPHPYAMVDILREIDKRFSRNISADLLVSPDKPLPGKCSKLLTIAGQMPDAIGVMPTDNTPFVNTPTLNARRKRIISDVVDLMFNDLPLTAAPIAMKDHSRSCFPDFETSASYKMSIRSIIDKNFGSILNLIKKKDYFSLAKDYRLVWAYMAVRRAQADKAKFENLEGDFVATIKDRYIYTIKKEKVLLNRLLKGWNHFFQVRLRTACALTTGVNQILATYLNPSRLSYLREYKESCHTVSAEQMISILNARPHFKFGFCIDVVNFDNGHPSEYLNYRIDCHDINPEFKHAWKVAMRAPFVFSNDGTGLIKDLAVLGDIRNPELDMEYRCYGEPSGITSVSDDNKVSGYFQYFDTLEICFDFIIPKSRRAAIMKGQDPQFFLIQCGDDAMYFFSQIGDYNKCMEFVKTRGKECFFQSEIEAPGSLLGVLLHYLEDKKKWSAFHNLNSSLSNLLVPERDIHSLLRSRWDLGWAANTSFYGEGAFAHPLYNDFADIRNRVFRARFGIDIMKRLGEITNEKNLNFLDEGKARTDSIANFLKDPRLTSIDKQVLIKPDLINYRFSQDDLTPLVRDFLFKMVPFHSYEKSLKLISDRKVV